MAQDFSESAQESVALAPGRPSKRPAQAEPELFAALDLGTNSCRMLIAALAVVGIAGTVAAVIAFTPPVSSPTPGDKSIAILPFENRSPSNSDSGYGDWLSELIRITAAELPLPKKKSPKGKRP